MTTAYGESIGGVSGDMFVGALIDSGLPLRLLNAELRKLGSLQFRLAVKKKLVHGIRATHFRVDCPAHEPSRSWSQIKRLIERSKLHSDIKQCAIGIFSIIAKAEAQVHGIKPEEVHFHEVGATDSIIDIMATAIGCRQLKIDRWRFSPLPLGNGTTQSQHGPIPLPAPATLEILRGVPVIGVEITGETVTPTGAAIVKYLGESFGPMPPMKIARIAYSTGTKEWPQRPNLFRVVMGTAATSGTHETMMVIETNIDDMNPEFYDYVFERLFAAGARDVFLTNIQMKKNRPGTMLRVIGDFANRDLLAQVILTETSSIGVRCYPVERFVLRRTSGIVKTRYGNIKVKIVDEPGGTRRATPEYDELKRIAMAKKVTLKQVADEVTRNFRK